MRDIISHVNELDNKRIYWDASKHAHTGTSRQIAKLLAWGSNRALAVKMPRRVHYRVTRVPVMEYLPRNQPADESALTSVLPAHAYPLGSTLPGSQGRESRGIGL